MRSTCLQIRLDEGEEHIGPCSHSVVSCDSLSTHSPDQEVNGAGLSRDEFSLVVQKSLEELM